MNKLILGFLLSVFCLALRAQDLSQGTNFVDGQRVTASELNSIVNGATILPGFISTKPAASALGGGDLVLLYSGGVLYKISGNAMLLQNTAFITAQVEKTAPVGTDFALIYDTAASAFKKVSLTNLAAVHGSFPLVTNAPLGDLVRLFHAGGNSWTTISNLFQTFTNLPTAPSVTATDQFLMFSYNAGLTKVPASTLAMTKTFTTNILTMTNSLNTAHGLGATPTVICTLTCTNAVLDYAVGDTVSFMAGDPFPAAGAGSWSIGANATNIYFYPNYFTYTSYSAATFGITLKTNPFSSSTTLVKNWTASIKAVLYQQPQ